MATRVALFFWQFLTLQVICCVWPVMCYRATCSPWTIWDPRCTRVW